MKSRTVLGMTLLALFVAGCGGGGASGIAGAGPPASSPPLPVLSPSPGPAPNPALDPPSPPASSPPLPVLSPSPGPAPNPAPDRPPPPSVVDPPSTVVDNFDLNELGTWAYPLVDSDLKRFGFFGTSTGFIIEPGRHQVLGTPSTGPETGIGTATWTGIVIGREGSNEHRFLHGKVAATMDLTEIEKLTVDFTDMSFQGSDTEEPDINAALIFDPKHQWWYAPTISAKFYAVGADSTGMVAGEIELTPWKGTWGAAKD